MELVVYYVILLSTAKDAIQPVHVLFVLAVVMVSCPALDLQVAAWQLKL